MTNHHHATCARHLPLTSALPQHTPACDASGRLNEINRRVRLVDKIPSLHQDRSPRRARPRHPLTNHRQSLVGKMEHDRCRPPELRQDLAAGLRSSPSTKRPVKSSGKAPPRTFHRTVFLPPIRRTEGISPLRSARSQHSSVLRASLFP